MRWLKRLFARGTGIIGIHRHVFHVNGLAAFEHRKDVDYTATCSCGWTVTYAASTWRWAKKRGYGYTREMTVYFESLKLGG